ncbi:MAG: hypothetical protein ABIH53_00550 [archaeon]
MSYRSKKVRVKKGYNSVCRSLAEVPFLRHTFSRIAEDEISQNSSYYCYSRGPINGWVIVEGNHSYPATLEVRADLRDQVKRIYGELEKKL